VYVRAGPVGPGAANVRAEVLRRGKSTTFVELRLEANEGVCSTATIMLVDPREHPVVHRPELGDFPAVDGLTDIPYVPKVFPEFMQHLTLRKAVGGFPFSGCKTTRFGGYAKFKHRIDGWEGATMMADTWPASVLPMCKGPAVASTAQWQLQLTPAAEHARSDAWFAMDTEVRTSADGAAATSAHMYQDGQLLACWQQSVLVY
jgi:hypothetical protein